MQEKHRKLLIIPAILFGLLVLFLLTKGRSEAPRTSESERATPVRIITVQPRDVTPRAVGYGTVRPARVWSAVSQVSGRVVELPDRVKAGKRIQADDLLLQIDEADYQLALSQAEANILSAEAQLKQLDAQEKNYRNSLAIEQRALSSSKKELQRKRKLAKQGTISASSLDTQERSHLNQLQSVQNLTNSLELIPADRTTKQASLAQQQAALAQAQLNLQRTRIVAPFNARLASVNIEHDQYVRQGEVLAELDDMGQAEIEVQLPIAQFAQLLPRINISELISQGVTPGPHLFNLQATVRIVDSGVEWPARFVRTSAGIDPQTRTVGAVVAVDKPYENALPPLRPPLLKGLYVEVEFRGPPRTAQLAIPGHALHGNQVYIVNSEQRLERRLVETGLTQPGSATINSGIAPGEQLIISDLIPAIDGMLLQPMQSTPRQAVDTGALQQP
ncbi:hypothetical protein BOW53_10335 [Solemya pervernicosa gill symbiont]|uniref:Uncharacterized protein n=2 Tax=Gammaproteobacteria incertae sedis TaxID=118884 RepID=A0A1T2L3V8_9GAMM|nr:biotin/lipoyl-binding protein [Candidatus Reidiella endopervernicosa]OOZ39764.1 hypothetical protein BOW53_10335 [Solemya pervernicosa gill symbiont]QKQ27919.1 biotin/lipoyl-binding protein [Candidatus Reidiella endopervernicosa]